MAFPCALLPLFFPCDGLSFGLALPGAVCSALTARKGKPARSLALAGDSAAPTSFTFSLKISSCVSNIFSFLFPPVARRGFLFFLSFWLKILQPTLLFGPLNDQRKILCVKIIYLRRTVNQRKLACPDSRMMNHLT